jgi:SAM-dependent methyltransferase
MANISKRFELILQLCRGEILDLGSTNYERGSSLNQLLGENHRVYSCDLYGNPDYKVDLNSKAWNIPRKFDTIVAGEIIEHVRDPIQFLKNCYKLLRPNGIIILTTPNATSIQYTVNPNWCVGSKNNLCHIHSFTSGMIRVLMENAGFNNIKTKYLNSYSKNPLSILASKIFPRLNSGIMAAGVKNEKA